MKPLVLLFFLLSIISVAQAQEISKTDSIVLQFEQEENRFQKVLLLINFVEHTIGITPTTTLAYQPKALSYFEKDIFPTRDFVATILASLIDRSQGKFDLAAKKNLEVVTALENYQPASRSSQLLLSKMLGYLGQIYTRSHYYEPVLGYLFKALAIAEEHHYLEGQGMALNGLAVVYSEGFEDNELAIEYGNRALALLKQSDNQYGIMILIENLARYQTNLGNLEQALPLHKEAIRLATTLNRTPYLGDFYNNLGANYLEQGQLEKAVEYCQKAIAVASESRNEFLLAYTYHLLGKCRQQQKQWKESATYFERALKIAQQNRDFKLISDIFHDFGQSATQNKQSTKASIYFQEAIAYKDSIYQALKIKQVLELETRHRLQNIEKEKALLQQEKAFQDKVIGGQRQQLWLLGGFGCLAIISSLVFFFQKKQLRNSYHTLVEKNRALLAIEQQLPPAIKNAPVDQALKEKIQVALIEQQLYLQPDLTVHKLAKQLDSNTTYVSKTINEGFNKNFSSLVNEYRIKAALQLLEEGLYEQYTIESLGHQAGFKSRPAFNNAFKKYTGVTPSFYIKQLKEQNK